MMPRNSPTPAETASFRFCGIEFDDVLADAEDRDQKEQHAGAEHRGERLLPGVFVGQHHGEGEEGVDAHAGRERDRVIGVERHHHGAHRGGDAGGDEHRALVHAGLAQDRRVDEHDVDHGQERGQAGDEFGADVGALLLEPEILLQHRREPAFAGSPPPSLPRALPSWPWIPPSPAASNGKPSLYARGPQARLRMLWILLYGVCGRSIAQPSRFNGSSPWIRRGNERGTSGTMAGNCAFRSAGGVRVLSGAGHTSRPPCSRTSAALAHGLRSGAQSK